MTASEEAVLAPLDSSIEDDDEWPEFRLKDVTVFETDGLTPTSLLTASNLSGLLVRGVLDEIDDDKERLVLDRSLLEQPIQLSDVRRYAYGQFEEGGVGLWAEGRAGWFLIEPAAEYKSIFVEMVEAIEMLYFLADNSKKSGPRRGGYRGSKGTDEQCRSLFKKYVEHTNYRYEDVEDAAGAFYKHREFLILTMLSGGGKERVNWPISPFYRHMRQKFPEDFARVKMKYEQIQRKSSSDEEPETSVQPVAQLSTQITKASRSSRRRQELELGVALRSNDSSEEADVNDRVVDLHQRPHKRKSLLRPKSSKFARTGAGKGVSVSVTSRDEVSDNEDPITEELGSQRMEKGTRNTKTTKRARAASGSNDGSHPESMHSDTESSHKAHDVAAFKILEQLTPSFTPQGPGDVWTCAVDGCSYKVYQASKAYSQQMIDEHFKSHNFGARDKLDLVLKEERPHLPIRSDHDINFIKLLLTFSSNLIRRIHRIASTHTLTDPMPTDSFPERIQRRY